MTDKASHKKRPRDANQLARSVVDEATHAAAGEIVPAQAKDAMKDAAAVSLGRRGGLKGGKARAENLGPDRRREIAKRAAEARWLAKANKGDEQ